MEHPAFTSLEQDQLDWMSRFADRVRLDVPGFAREDCGDELNEVARTLWEDTAWRGMAPEAAAEQWLAGRSRH
jgi:hypothetical protein